MERESDVSQKGLESLQAIAKAVSHGLDLKLAQERLVKASRLAAIGEVSLTVRHEVNNPLTVILGETQFLLLGQDLPEEAKASLKTVEKMCLRIQNVVKKLSEVKEDKTKEFMKGLKTIDFD
jgi:two-component system NtrC family sensor kinase